MKISAITCTYQRPEAFALCEKYMARQIRPVDQWIVLNGPEPMPQKVLKCIESGEITGDYITWAEDDDYFSPTWLAWIESMGSKNYDLIGEGNAAYYNVQQRSYCFCENKAHAALCQTAVTRDMLDEVASVIRSCNNPWFDVRLYGLDCNKFISLPQSPEERRVVGMKAVGNTKGYSGEHRYFMQPGTFTDPSLLTLFKWLGNDAAAYAKFFNRP